MEPVSTSEFLPGAVPKGAKTHEFYHISEKLPARFDNPGQTQREGLERGNPVFTCTGSPDFQIYRMPCHSDWFQGYSGKSQHPMYRTTSFAYGSRPPSVHTVPTQFHGKSQKFSAHLGTCGMYRNCSLNTEVDKSKV